MPAADLSLPNGREPPGADLEVRDAVVCDLPRLVDIENQVFAGDRLTRRAFRHLLVRAHAINLVATSGGEVVGYVSVLLRRGSHYARIYSLAVDPRWQGRGVGGRLLEAAESRAAGRGCTFVRLEVRADNARAIGQYVRAGYGEIGIKPAYYDDGETALRFQKPLAAVVGTRPA
jgi:ribosomal-protein-alanine acetyltransferase